MRQRELGVEIFCEGSVDQNGHAEAPAVLGGGRGASDAHVPLGRVPAANGVSGGDVVCAGRCAQGMSSGVVSTAGGGRGGIERAVRGREESGEWHLR